MSSKGILWLTLPGQTSPVGILHTNPANHLHVTLQFGAEYTAEIEELMDKEVEVVAVADCSNDRVQALQISLPAEIRAMCNNANPHMTISMQDGVKPVESNDMLAGEHSCTSVSIPLTLKFGFFHFDKN